MVRVCHDSLPLGSSSHILQNQEMGVPTMQNDVLQVVRPGRHVEVFREPIIAGELMKKYPRHCIARPDVFEFPWIAVRPESVLPLGEVFFLVPYYTVDILLKGRRQQHKQSSKLFCHCLSYNRQKSPMKSLAGVTRKHHCKKRHCKHRNVNDQECCKDSDTGSLYKFVKKVMRRSPNQPEESYHCHYQLDLPVDSSGRPRVRSPEQIELLRLEPCLRKPDSVRKKLNLRVTFASPLVVSSLRRISR